MASLDSSNPFVIKDSTTTSNPFVVKQSTNVDNRTKYLDMLSAAEGASDNTIVGGSTFDDYSQHPNVVGLRTKEGPSTAAGRYQITKSTYDEVAPSLGITDFSPDSQSKIALELIRRKGALEDIDSGNFDAANKKLGGVWASLPSSPYSQPKRSEEWIKSKLNAGSETFVKGAQGNPFILPKGKSTNPFVLGTTQPTTEDTNTWIPSWQQAKKESFALRALVGVGALDKSTLPTVQEPEMSLKESLKAMGDSIIHRPLDTAKAITRGLIEDPELLYPGLWETAPVKIAGMLGKVATVGKAAGRAAAVGAGLETTAQVAEGKLDSQKIVNTAAGFGVLSGAMHGLGSLVKGKGTTKGRPDLTPEEFDAELSKFESMGENTSQSFEDWQNSKRIQESSGSADLVQYHSYDAWLKAHKDAGMSDIEINNYIPNEAEFLKQRDSQIQSHIEEPVQHLVRSVWDEGGMPYSSNAFGPGKKGVSYTDRFGKEAFKELDEAELRRQYEADRKVKSNTDTQQELSDNPSLYELGNVFRDDAYTEKTGLNAIHRVLADISLNKRAAKIGKELIERLIPNKKIRERLTMSIEGERETDRLLTDIEKQKLLYGTGRVLPGTQFIDTGLTGVLPRMLAKIERTPEGGMISYFDSKIGSKVTISREGYIKKYEALKHVVDTLKELPSEENAIKLQKIIEGKFAEMGKIAKREGVLENLRQNYIAHVIDFSESVLSKEHQKTLLERLNLDPKESRLNRDFSEARIYRYIRDLEHRVYEVANDMGLDTTGLKVQRDVARIYEVYQESMGNAIIQKRLTNFLENKLAIEIPEIGSDGQVKSVVKLGLITKNLKLALENKYEQFTGYGSDALKGYLVHPDLIPALGHLFRQTDPNLVLRAASAVSMLSKTVTTMASMFHATSLAWARMGATPFGMLKEIGSGFSGTRAALETLRHDGFSKDIDNWTRAGLKFETEDIQQGILPDAARNVDNFVTKLFTKNDVRLTRRVIDPIDTHVLQNMNTLTWDFMHSAGKFDVAQTLFANMKAKNPHMADQAIYNEVASFVNNTFGGLDWLKVADEVQNKTLKNLAISMSGLQGRTWMQVLMFAPDWTISTLRSYSKALPKELYKPHKWEIKKGAQGLINPTTSGDLARRYVLTTGVLYLTLINGINMAITGRPVWTNKDPTRIDLGDGTTMQLAKHSMEGPHWVLHPIKTGVNKLGYIPKTAVTLASPYVNTPMDALKVIGEPFVPFQISAAAKAPSGERLKRGISSFMGFPIYGQTDKQHSSVEINQERKEKRRASRLANKEEKLKRQ